MGVDHIFELVAERLVREDAGVDRARMLHSAGLRTAGKFFAFVRHDELVLKLPAGRVRELIASGAGSPCDPGKDRPMREWVCVKPESESACTAYVAEARAFVAARQHP